MNSNVGDNLMLLQIFENKKHENFSMKCYFSQNKSPFKCKSQIIDL